MASKVKAPVKKAPKKKNGYEMPQALKAGEILVDQQKTQWKIGVSIGSGGFGEIYSACKVGSNVKKVEDYPYAAKVVSYKDPVKNIFTTLTTFINILGAQGEWPALRRDALLHAQR